MKIAFVTPEFQSLVRRTNLAEIAEALPTTLAKAGHDIRVIMPHSREIDLGRLQDVREIGTIEVKDIDDTATITVREGRLGLLTLVLLDHTELFTSRSPYGDDNGPYADNWRRYSVFARAVLECLPLISFKAEILHCFDWTCGLIPLFRQLEYADKPKHPAAKAGIYFAIQNIAMQGAFERDVLTKIGIPTELFRHVEGVALDGRVNFLKTGIEFATIVGTHSEFQAESIQNLDRGYGLEESFSRRQKELVGISSGIDYSTWDPETDKLIAATYSGESEKALAGKKRCKSHLQQAYRLDKGPRTPVISVIGRFDAESGFDIVAEVLTQLLERGFEVVMMGQGHENIIERVRTVETTFAGRCRMIEGFHVSAAHEALAGSDMVILPSHFLSSMSLCAIGMRYGAIPIVYSHAGVNDIVVDRTDDEKNGTAFTFKAYNGEGLIEAADQARAVYKSAADWTDLTLRSMSQDFSWHRCGGEYIKAYRRVTRRVRAHRDAEE
ncbi:MAG: starch synthase [Candidatus Paceibacteria bacterium]